MPTMWGTLAPVLVPETISRRQFYQELANRGMITKDEALAAIVTNTLPAELEAMVDAIVDDEIRWQARMLLAGAAEFKRNNWFVGFFAAMKSLSIEYMDDFWGSGALLD